jgi:hypothetical protein
MGSSDRIYAAPLISMDFLACWVRYPISLACKNEFQGCREFSACSLLIISLEPEGESGTFLPDVGLEVLAAVVTNVAIL